MDYGVSDAGGSRQYRASHDVGQREQPQYVPEQREPLSPQASRGKPSDDERGSTDVDVHICACESQHLRDEAINPKLMDEQFDADAKSLRADENLQRKNQCQAFSGG